MSSRDNLKQLMKKQQLLFDTLDTKPAFTMYKRNDSQSASNKLLNSSGYSAADNSNLQGSFQMKSNDVSGDRLNVSHTQKQAELMKKQPSQKLPSNNQFLRTNQREDATRVQKFINEIFQHNQNSFRSANNSASNSPYKSELRPRAAQSPSPGPYSTSSTVSRLYNQIHSKIDSRVKQTSEERQLPQVTSVKNLQHQLIQKYLSGSSPKKRPEMPFDPKKRLTNAPPITKVYGDALEQDARPKTEGYHQKLEERKDPYGRIGAPCRKTVTDRNTPITDKDTTISSNNESKTDEKGPKQRPSVKAAPPPAKKIITPQSIAKAFDELPIEKVISLEENIFTVLAVVSKQIKVTKLCKNYLITLNDMNLDCLQIVYPEQEQFKVMSRGIILERLGVMVILLESMGQSEDFEEVLQNVKNLLLYIHNNQIQMLESLSEKLQAGEKGKQIDARLAKLQASKPAKKAKMDRFSLIKKNNNIIFSILTLMIENPMKENYLELEKILLSVNQLTLQQGTLLILSCFQKLLSQINQLRLSQDTQLTEKTFDEDLEVEEDVKVPYLPKRNDVYTLVLDLDETLVHYQELSDGGQFLVRPYAEQFLLELSKYYELVIFTAALQDYADFILDIIDNNKVITHRLYRQHTTIQNGQSVKDLSRLGRDLAKMLIIDNLPENFSCQPDNGIYVQSWFGEAEDRALFELAPLLKEIVKKKVPDVREALRKYRDKMIDNISKGVQDPHLNLSLD